jgi:hypothetical protein
LGDTSNTAGLELRSRHFVVTRDEKEDNSESSETLHGHSSDWNVWFELLLTVKYVMREISHVADRRRSDVGSAAKALVVCEYAARIAV